MAKIGLSEYNVNTNRYDDLRIKRLRKEFGCCGIAVYDFILCRIYRENGSYLQWDDEVCFDIADYFNVKESLVNEIMGFCCAVGLFSDVIFKAHKVITSESIQKTFEEFCIKNKRKSMDIPEYLLITPEETQKTPEEMPKTPEYFGKLQSDLANKVSSEKNSGGNGKNSGVNEKTPEEMAKTPEEMAKTPEFGFKEKKEQKDEKEKKEKESNKEKEIKEKEEKQEKKEKTLLGEIFEKNDPLETRKNNFLISLRPFIAKYGTRTVDDFFEYWSEMNRSGTKMRYELEKVFEINRRLATWKRREKPQFTTAATEEYSVNDLKF